MCLLPIVLLNTNTAGCSGGKCNRRSFFAPQQSLKLNTTPHAAQCDVAKFLWFRIHIFPPLLFSLAAHKKCCCSVSMIHFGIVTILQGLSRISFATENRKDCVPCLFNSGFKLFIAICICLYLFIAVYVWVSKLFWGKWVKITNDLNIFRWQSSGLNINLIHSQSNQLTESCLQRVTILPIFRGWTCNVIFNLENVLFTSVFIVAFALKYLMDLFIFNSIRTRLFNKKKCLGLSFHFQNNEG